MDARLLALLASLPLAITALLPPSQRGTSDQPHPGGTRVGGAAAGGMFFLQKYCVSCHTSPEKLDPVKMHDRVLAGEMPPKEAALRPSTGEKSAYLSALATQITAREKAKEAREGRATQRRLNSYEYENALRDLFQAPWLQIRGQFPEDGEAYRFNKVGEALDVSHVHLARYLAAADYAIREVIRTHERRTPTTTKRFYARDQQTLTKPFTQNAFNTSPDRQTYPVLGAAAQPDVRYRRAPPHRACHPRARSGRLGFQQLCHGLYLPLGSVQGAHRRALPGQVSWLHPLDRPGWLAATLRQWQR